MTAGTMMRLVFVSLFTVSLFLYLYFSLHIMYGLVSWWPSCGSLYSRCRSGAFVVWEMHAPAGHLTDFIIGIVGVDAVMAPLSTLE